VTAARDGSDVVVTVADTGIGISPKDLHNIFEMFTQINGALEHAQGGLGIGLTLSKRLVQMHGGSIEAKSTGEGRGSEFIVRVPVMTEPIEAVSNALVNRSPPACRILVVDDNQDAATSLAVLLQITGRQGVDGVRQPAALGDGKISP
jgi:hypothetical protein